MDSNPPLHRLRNIGIIAHIDAGKTTTSERFLYYAGVTHALGDVDSGSTQLDWMEEERERGITITSAATRLAWRDHAINLIDTPGHVDFTAEVERSLRVLDGAVVVLCAVGGVEPQSEMVWHQAERYKVPRILFINKMDRVGADFDAVLADIEATLKVKPVPLTIPVGAEDRFSGVLDLLSGRMLVWDPEGDGRSFDARPIPEEEEERFLSYRRNLVEAVSAEDDALLAAFLEDREPSVEEIRSALRRATLDRRLFPVFAGAALRNVGIQPLLDAVVDYLPAPDDVAALVAVRADTGERLICPADVDAPLLALVFKTVNERERGRASYVRIYAGRITEGMQVQVPRQKATERIARLFRVHADKRQKLIEATAGDILVVAGLKIASTGDTITEGTPLLLDGLSFPEPVVSAALEARSAADVERVAQALGRLAGDDPTFRYRIDEATGQTVISGMGELHLEVLEERLQREYGLKVRMGRPEVTYRETITRSVRSQGHYDRFTGGRQHAAELTLEISPRARGEGFRFLDRLAPGTLPAHIAPVVEQAVVDAKESGIQFGYPVVDLEASLVEARWSEQHSTEFGFRNAALSAFRDGCRQAAPVLLEPIVSLEIVTPKEFVGGVMTTLAARQGRVHGTEMKDQLQVLHATAPLSRMFGYTTDLRSSSQGRAFCAMTFSHFDVVTGGRPFGT